MGNCHNKIYNAHTNFTYGPFSESKNKKSSIENKFYACWFPGTYEFGFSLGNSLKLVKVVFDKNDGVKLESGRVYGAIKYNGKWLAARITKLHKDKK